MGLFDKLLGGGGSETTTLDRREAFTAVLLAAVAADGHISDDESRSFNAIVNRMQLYKDQTGAQFSTMLDRLIGLLRKHGASFLLEKAATSLPPELRETAFAVVADLVFADGVVEAEEKELIGNIHKALNLPDELALKILEVISIKNRG